MAKWESDDVGDAYLKGEFMAMDYTGNGVISTADFLSLLQYLGEHNPEKIKSLLKEVHPNEDNTLTIDEYYKVMKRHPEILKETSKMRQLFRKFDLNGDGKAYKNDIIEGFRKMKVEIDDEIRDKIDKLDISRDGKVEYRDFIRAHLEQRKIIPHAKASK